MAVFKTSPIREVPGLAAEAARAEASLIEIAPAKRSCCSVRHFSCCARIMTPLRRALEPRPDRVNGHCGYGK
jgi:hypothetical protein